MNFKQRLSTALAITTAFLGVANQQATWAAPRPVQSQKPPEHYLAQGKGAEYIPLAKAYLDSKPADPQASQVAWSLFVTASTLDDVQETRSARLRLCADFPTSLPTQYLLKSTSAKAWQFLKGLLQELRPASGATQHGSLLPGG